MATGAASDVPTYDVEVTRTFDAPVERVWRAWADADEVKKWWGPEGFSCPLAEVDLRVGGRTLVAMQASPEYGGGTWYNTWNFSRVEPLSRIEYTINFTDAQGNRLTPTDAGLSADTPVDGRHEVTFHDLGDGRTQMRMVEHGFRSAEMRDRSRMGLDQCLDKMERSFA